MVSEYADGLQDAAALALDGQSSDVESQSAEGSEENALDALVTLLEDRLDRRLSARVTEAYRGAESQRRVLERMVTDTLAEFKASGATRDDVLELRELLESVYPQSDEDRAAAQTKRDARRYREEQAKAKNPPAAPKAESAATDDAAIARRFQSVIIPDFERHGTRSGITQAEMSDPGWMGRLYAAGAPAAWSDWSDAGEAQYKALVYGAIDRVATEKRASGRQRTVVANPATGGGGSARVSRADIAKWGPSEIAANMDKVLDQMGAR